MNGCSCMVISGFGVKGRQKALVKEELYMSVRKAGVGWIYTSNVSKHILLVFLEF
jgi:hypothetical protein